MAKKKQTANQKDGAAHYGRLPQKVLEEMTPEIKRQYFLWDEILKRQIERYPSMLLPLIREIFGKEYPAGTDIKILSTEYVVEKVHEQGQRLLESIRSDLLVQVGNKDLYHMECQMKRGGNISVRMLEYDMNIALVHGLEQIKDDAKGHARKYRVNFPQSAILYLDDADKTSAVESCVIVYPDGTEYEYCVPVLNAQGYTPEMVGEKELDILFPFLAIRFRKRFETILKKKGIPSKAAKAHEEMETLKKDLTKLASDCIMIINRKEENGRMSGRMGADILGLMGKTYDYLYKKEPGLLREVHEAMEPAIKLLSEELEERLAIQQEKLDEINIQLTRKSEELTQKDEQLTQKDEQLSHKDAQLTKKSEELTLKNEELNQKNKELNQNRQQLAQKNEELAQHIKNYIHLCKEENKSNSQTAQTLQKIFSLTLAEAKEMLAKYW